MSEDLDYNKIYNENKQNYNKAYNFLYNKILNLEAEEGFVYIIRFASNIVNLPDDCPYKDSNKNNTADRFLTSLGYLKSYMTTKYDKKEIQSETSSYVSSVNITDNGNDTYNVNPEYSDFNFTYVENTQDTIQLNFYYKIVRKEDRDTVLYQEKDFFDKYYKYGRFEKEIDFKNGKLNEDCFTTHEKDKKISKCLKIDMVITFLACLIFILAPIMFYYCTNPSIGLFEALTKFVCYTKESRHDTAFTQFITSPIEINQGLFYIVLGSILALQLLFASIFHVRFGSPKKNFFKNHLSPSFPFTFLPILCFLGIFGLMLVYYILLMVVAFVKFICGLFGLNFPFPPDLDIDFPSISIFLLLFVFIAGLAALLISIVWYIIASILNKKRSEQNYEKLAYINTFFENNGYQDCIKSYNQIIEFNKPYQQLLNKRALEKKRQEEIKKQKHTVFNF